MSQTINLKIIQCEVMHFKKIIFIKVLYYRSAESTELVSTGVCSPFFTSLLNLTSNDIPKN